MVALHRITAVYLRHIYLVPRSINDFIDRIFFPFFDMIRFGFMACWIQWLLKSVGNGVTVEMLALIIAWHVLYFTSIQMVHSLLEEINSNNLLNLFSSPVLLREWVYAVVLVTVVKGIFTAAFGGFTCWLIYGVNPLFLDWLLIPQFVLAWLSGLVVGMLGCAGVINWGDRAKNLSWSTAWVFSPFMGAFYPLHVLPLWAQKIGYCLPMTYIFENIRFIIATGRSSHAYTAISVGLAMLLLVVFTQLFYRTFERTRRLSFDHLYN